MACWRIEFSNEAHKQYRKLPVGYRRNIDTVLKRLTERGPIDIKPVKGKKDVYRIRVGRYRILIKAITEDNTYLVFRISTKGGAYKK
ncbi:hypothetical protein DRQ36_10175 [bacterium]|nr:MAG: hypothetical protein DRQ36_10175 [bacterium]